MPDSPAMRLPTGEVIVLGQVVHYVQPGSGPWAQSYRAPSCGHAEVIAIFPAPRQRLVLLRDQDTGMELRWSPTVSLSGTSPYITRLYAKEEEALTQIRHMLRADRNTVDRSITSLEGQIVSARQLLSSIDTLLTHHQ